jgi:hypothetical protein
MGINNQTLDIMAALPMTHRSLLLCGWIDSGKAGRVELDTLCGYVWPDETTNPNTLKI